MNILHVDSRQKLYHKEFGDIPTVVPAERIFTYTDIVEPVGSEACTAISDVKAAESQTGQIYDYTDLFNNTPHTGSGAFPPDTFAAMVSKGLLRLGTTIRDTLWQSYWRVDTEGAGDRFDNTITASNHANSVVTVWTNFYENWLNLIPGEVMPPGQGNYTDHDWIFKGWQVVNGVTMAVVDMHLGRTNLMPREIFNMEVSRLGCGTGIPVTTTIATVENRDFLTWATDVITNAWITVTMIAQEIKNYQAGTFPPTSTELAWDTRGNCSHSVRVLCDELGLTLDEKNIIWACIAQESGFSTHAVGKENPDGTHDWGICQFNDGKNAKGIPLWIGQGALFPSTDFVLANPEACVREMIAMFKAGHINWWVSYSSGMYLSHLPYVPIP